MSARNCKSHKELLMYWGLLFGLGDSFRERDRALMIGLTGLYSERQSSPSLVSFVRVQFQKTFSAKKVLRFQNYCTVFRKTRNTLKRMLLRKSTFVTGCGTVNVCVRAHAMQDCMYGTVFVVRTCLEHCRGFSSRGNARLIPICI